MKTLWNKKNAAYLSAIIAIIFIFVFYSNTKASGISEDKLSKYLSRNSSSISKDNFSESEFKLLNHDLNKNIVFLSGYQCGGISEDDKIEDYGVSFKFLKYLNQKAGVRFYLSDMGFSDSEIINKYLNTGDELFLKKIYSNYDGRYYDFKKLYEYNRTLDNDKKIKVCGIGIQENWIHDFIYINMLINESKKPPESIKKTIYDIKNYKNIITDNKSFIELTQKIHQNMETNTDDYKKYLGRNYGNFKYVIDEEINSLNVYDKISDNNNEFNKFKQSTLYKNFRNIYAKQGGKYYGCFEISEASQKHMISNSIEYKHFGEILSSKDSPVYKKVISIEFLYKNCKCPYNISRDNGYSTADFITVSSKENNLDLLSKSSKSDMTLFKFNGFNSPFKKTQYFVSYSEGGVITDYFEYAVLIKNAKPDFKGLLSNLDEEGKNIFKYINNNKYNIDIKDNDNLSSFKVLDNDIKKYEIFLTGENHAVAFNGDVRLKFLKYLNKNAGVNYCLAELSYSAGVLINKYLKTGDESILRSVYAEFNKTFAYDENEFETWIKLYNYNKGLPPDKKITVIGIDIEFQKNTTRNCLEYLIKDKKVPSSIADSINIIKNIGMSSTNVQNIRSAKTIYDDIQKKKSIYENFLGENYFDFEMTLRNMIDTSTDSNDKRENTLYKNFNLIYSHYPKGKYFGEFGGEHTYLKKRKSKFLNVADFAAQLNGNGSLFKGKVLSIPYIYFNCKYRNTDNNGDNFVTKTFDNALIFYDFSNSQNKNTLYKLDSKNSPFARQLYLVQNADGGVATDYFEYVLTINDSPASSPYR